MRTNIVFLHDKSGTSNLITRLLADLQHDERVTVCFSYVPLKSNMLEAVRKVHFSRKINSVVRLPFKRIWGCVLDKLDWYDDGGNYLLMINTIMDYLDFSYLDKLRKNHHVKIVMVLTDPFSTILCKNAKAFHKKYGFDYVYTFDPKDAEKYGFAFHTIPYSVFEELSRTVVQYDLGFVGNNKGRSSVINNILKCANDAKVSFQVRLGNVMEKDKLQFPGIIYNAYVDYKEVVSEDLQCNCLLDVLSDGQTGATLRYYEAVAYNRKLLTNNPYVIELPFYNPDYIHIFTGLEDIDWDWVKERTSVEFHYDGRFSPSRLIDDVLRIDE